MTQPTLTLFCGPPGAGKSTLARRLEAEGRGVRLSTDEWQVALGADGNDPELHARLQELLYRHALRLLEAGTDVILEDGLWTRGERTEKFADARARGARIEWHVFDVDPQVLRQRLARRNGEAAANGVVVDDEELARALSVFQVPDADELELVDRQWIHHGGLPTAATMEAAEAAAVVAHVVATGATHQVNGGWAVDALAGRQTREHGDLDLFVDEAAVPELLSWLASRDYEPVEDWLPVRIELAGPRGRVDMHPMVVQPNGDGIQQGLGDEVFVHRAAERAVGSIEGVQVVTASAARLRELRRGYPAREEDRHDLRLLDELAGGAG